jgi:hypothetical protein
VRQGSKRHRRSLVTALGQKRSIHRQTTNHRDGEAILLTRQFRHGCDDSSPEGCAADYTDGKMVS